MFLLKICKKKKSETPLKKNSLTTLLFYFDVRM